MVTLYVKKNIHLWLLSLYSTPLRSCSTAHLSSGSEGSSSSLTSLFTGNLDTTDVFNVDDDQIQQLEEPGPTFEMEPDFSPTVRT